MTHEPFFRVPMIASVFQKVFHFTYLSNFVGRQEPHGEEASVELLRFVGCPAKRVVGGEHRPEFHVYVSVGTINFEVEIVGFGTVPEGVQPAHELAA